MSQRNEREREAILIHIYTEGGILEANSNNNTNQKQFDFWFDLLRFDVCVVWIKSQLE